MVDDSDGPRPDTTTRRGWSAQLESLVALLWAGREGLHLGPGEDGAGRRELESYLVVPSRSHASFLVPMHAGRRTAAATLTSYQRLRTARARAPRRAVAAAIRSGLIPRGSQRLRVYADDDAPSTASPAGWLAAALGVEHLVAACAVPAPSPNAKPTLQLFTPDGVPAGYAKLSWNPSTQDQVRTEIAAATRYRSRLATLRMPALLGSGGWRGFAVAVTAPLPRDVVAWGVDRPAPPLTVTREIAELDGIVERSVPASPVLARARDIAPECSVEGTPLRDALAAAAEGVADRFGAAIVRHGTWHGDWVPWNLARRGNEIHAWDWEHSRGDVPVGFDLLHWQFQLSFIHRGLSLDAAIAEATARTSTQLRDLQDSGSAAEACSALYLIEIASRYLVQHEAGAGWHPRFFPAVLNSLSRLNRS